MALPAEPRGNRAVDRDALPGQWAVRGNKAPTIGARLGRGSRRCRGSPGRDDVGGPRLHSPEGASAREDHCSKKAELLHASLPGSTNTILGGESLSARKNRQQLQRRQKNPIPVAATP